MADRIVIEGKIIYPERKKYERHGACPACEGKERYFALSFVDQATDYYKRIE